MGLIKDLDEINFGPFKILLPNWDGFWFPLVKVEVVAHMILHLGVFWHGGGVELGSAAKEQISQAGFGESEFTLFRDTVAQIESGGEYDIQGGSGDMYAGRYQMGSAARQDAARFLGEEYPRRR